MSIEELVGLYGDLDASETDVVWFNSDSLRADGASVSLDIDLKVGESTHSRWRVGCEGTVEHQVTLGGHGQVGVHRDHVLLLDHVDRRAELYFTGEVPAPANVMGALVLAHDDVVGPWRPLHRYLNSLLPLQDLLAQPGGVLARGPATVLASYDEWLGTCGLRTSMLDGGPAKHWDATLMWVETPHDVSALVLSDFDNGSLPGAQKHSWVIATAFTTERIG